MSSCSIPNTSPFPVLSTSEGPFPSLNPLPQRNHQQWAPRRVRPPLRALAMRPRELAISPDELSPHAATMLLLQQADLQATSANQIPSPRSSTRKRRAIQPRAVHPPAQLTWVSPTVSANRQASQTDPKAQDWKFVTKAPKGKSCKTATIFLPRHAGLEAPSSNPNRIRSTRLSSRRRCTVESQAGQPQLTWASPWVLDRRQAAVEPQAVQPQMTWIPSADKSLCRRHAVEPQIVQPQLTRASHTISNHHRAPQTYPKALAQKFRTIAPKALSCKSGNVQA